MSSIEKIAGVMFSSAIRSTGFGMRDITVDTFYPLIRIDSEGGLVFKDDADDYRYLPRSTADRATCITILYSKGGTFEATKVGISRHPNSVGVRYDGERLGFINEEGLTLFNRSDLSALPASMVEKVYSNQRLKVNYS